MIYVFPLNIVLKIRKETGRGGWNPGFSTKTLVIPVRWPKTLVACLNPVFFQGSDVQGMYIYYIFISLLLILRGLEERDPR